MEEEGKEKEWSGGTEMRKKRKEKIEKEAGE